jgi:hypothetical protein
MSKEKRDEQLDERIEREISLMVRTFMADPLGASASPYKTKLEVLTSYISLRAQKETAHLTKTLIRWSRILSISTCVLASATVVVALVSYFR